VEQIQFFSWLYYRTNEETTKLPGFIFHSPCD